MRYWDPDAGTKTLTSSDVLGVLAGQDQPAAGNITLSANKTITAPNAAITALTVEPSEPGGNLAAAGGNQSTGALLAGGINYVTGADNTKGVLLPPLANTKIVIINTVGNKTLPVWAPLGNGTINGGSANGNITMGNGTSCIAYSLNGADFHTVPTVPS